MNKFLKKNWVWLLVVFFMAFTLLSRGCHSTPATKTVYIQPTPPASSAPPRKNAPAHHESEPKSESSTAEKAIREGIRLGKEGHTVSVTAHTASGEAAKESEAKYKEAKAARIAYVEDVEFRVDGARLSQEDFDSEVKELRADIAHIEEQILSNRRDMELCRVAARNAPFEAVLRQAQSDEQLGKARIAKLSIKLMEKQAELKALLCRKH